MNKKKKKILLLSSILVLSVVSIIGMTIAYVYHDMINRQGQAFYADLSVFSAPQFAQAMSGKSTADYEDTQAAFIPMLDFDALRNRFPDAVGWLQSEGLAINYPIMQTSDNDFYLNHLPDKTQNILGSIFLDYRNTLDFDGKNIFIYGHNTTTDAMFGSLKKYVDQQYYESNKTMHIYTPDNNFRVVLFAGYLLDSRNEHPPFTFTDEEDFKNYINEIKTRSFFQSNEQVLYGDTLVFICTCQEGRRGDARSWRRVLVGRLEVV